MSLECTSIPCYGPAGNCYNHSITVFCKCLADSSQLIALAGGFNLSDVCWKFNTVKKMESRRLLDSVEDKFLTQLVSQPARSNALLFTNREGLVGHVVFGGCFGHGDAQYWASVV